MDICITIMIEGKKDRVLGERETIRGHRKKKWLSESRRDTLEEVLAS